MRKDGDLPASSSVVQSEHVPEEALGPLLLLYFMDAAEQVALEGGAPRRAFEDEPDDRSDNYERCRGDEYEAPCIAGYPTSNTFSVKFATAAWWFRVGFRN